MGIQSGLNTMDHGLTTSSNHHPKLIWGQMKNKQIMKLQAESYILQLVENLSHYNWMDATKSFS